MGNAIAVAEVLSSIEQDILDAEHEIDKAQMSEGEAWLTYALQLERIKKDYEKAKKTEHKPFGLNSFNAYCKSDQSRFEQAYSTSLILCLPDYRLAKTIARAIEIDWTEYALRGVRKLKTTAARKAALKEAAEDYLEHEITLTAAVRDAVANKKTLKGEIDKRKELARQTDPAANLKLLIRFTEKHLDAFTAQPGAYWKAAEKSSPGIAADAARAVGKLAALLRKV